MKTSSKEISLREVVGKGYDDFWLCKKRYRVLKGGKGSKKSATTALNFVYRLMKYPKANLMVIRQVMQTHRNSTFAQLKWAIDRLGVSTQWRATLEPLELTYLPTGQKIMFRGFDDVLKLASTTVDTGYLCWVWIEEAFEIPDEDAFDMWMQQVLYFWKSKAILQLYRRGQQWQFLPVPAEMNLKLNINGIMLRI